MMISIKEIMKIKDDLYKKNTRISYKIVKDVIKGVYPDILIL